MQIPNWNFLLLPRGAGFEWPAIASRRSQQGELPAASNLSTRVVLDDGPSTTDLQSASNMGPSCCMTQTCPWCDYSSRVAPHQEQARRQRYASPQLQGVEKRQMINLYAYYTRNTRDAFFVWITYAETARERPEYSECWCLRTPSLRSMLGFNSRDLGS